jgi:hypothetical protein
LTTYSPDRADNRDLQDAVELLEEAAMACCSKDFHNQSQIELNTFLANKA